MLYVDYNRMLADPLPYARQSTTLEGRLDEQRMAGWSIRRSTAIGLTGQVGAAAAVIRLRSDSIPTSYT